MKFYLSSLFLGDQEHIEKLKKWLAETKKPKIAYIDNALDGYGINNRRVQARKDNFKTLEDVGFVVELLDLSDYFHRSEELVEVLNGFDAVYVFGGNTFVLNRVVKLSGFDVALDAVRTINKNFIYIGFSAGVCILQENLKGTAFNDEPEVNPYGDIEQEFDIYKGLCYFEESFVVHYVDSEVEPKEQQQELDYYKKNSLEFKTLKDGEVIIIDIV